MVKFKKAIVEILLQYMLFMIFSITTLHIIYPFAVFYFGDISNYSYSHDMPILLIVVSFCFFFAAITHYVEKAIDIWRHS